MPPNIGVDAEVNSTEFYAPELRYGFFLDVLIDPIVCDPVQG